MKEQRGLLSVEVGGENNRAPPLTGGGATRHHVDRGRAWEQFAQDGAHGLFGVEQSAGKRRELHGAACRALLQRPHAQGSQHVDGGCVGGEGSQAGHRHQMGSIAPRLQVVGGPFGGASFSR